MATAPVDPPDDRVPLPDPAAARRGARRTVLAGLVLVVLLTGFTAGGAAMLAAGELPGLPFAVGGALAQLAVVVIVLATLWARAGGDGRSISRSRVAATLRILAGLRGVLLVALLALAAYALVRLVQGDPWTLLTGAVIALFLWLLFRGAGRIRRHWTGGDADRPR
ncbi:hypothetical protein K7640_20765 [Micromonospora sp. PLK6-60]|uniref:hypothetical protein n=1 Tax=Micromonospora sp. PLK6-60 TaxID=2873383 RepID=UPI001CA61BAE|nr:hypothetical protein [Micromonospora sp. PLK6-60]MBY8874266.1 hypothetical protein [Micromonospora sp. PLK6-60]